MMQAIASKNTEPEIRRVWAMPNSETFDIPPIRALVRSYLRGVAISLDPFARNSRLCSYSNDLNPQTEADYHLDALEFLLLMKTKGIRPAVVLFDPPYSLRQCAEVYESVGKPVTQKDTQVFGRWTEHKEVVAELVLENGIVISCGWNSQGMGIQNGFKIIEILLVCHGGAHNDTIITVEQKLPVLQRGFEF